MVGVGCDADLHRTAETGLFLRSPTLHRTTALPSAWDSDDVMKRGVRQHEDNHKNPYMSTQSRPSLRKMTVDQEFNTAFLIRLLTETI